MIAEVALVLSALLLFTLAIKHYQRYHGWGPEDPALRIQSGVGILNARWTFDGVVTQGSWCTSKVGDVGAAWFTIAIAIMTFRTIFPALLSQSQARRLAGAMSIFISLFLFLMITITSTTIPHYYGGAGYALLHY
ncbi:hypothetical protein BS47DRAFT_1390700 [Hydnum rufescens UP504]|uniref:Uncharacterized protein n=1 Tax=Hydnum rufescens UP504 TaxID=1448309 RepID=A0A9P6DYY1_9AGAM|nr:hypothetical protein BS47DRAFT_1390700 [Hydnum rufescens UP504]